MGNQSHDNDQEVVHHHSHKKLYFMVFIALAILTAVEIAIPELKLAYFYHASWLTVLALLKAFLVAYIFMHLNEETRWMKLIALIPMSAFLYATMVVVESIVR
jgi:caa(3)-type oxidase subunit IV